MGYEGDGWRAHVRGGLGDHAPHNARDTKDQRWLRGTPDGGCSMTASHLARVSTVLRLARCAVLAIGQMCTREAARPRASRRLNPVNLIKSHFPWSGQTVHRREHLAGILSLRSRSPRPTVLRVPPSGAHALGGGFSESPSSRFISASSSSTAEGSAAFIALSSSSTTLPPSSALN